MKSNKKVIIGVFICLFAYLLIIVFTYKKNIFDKRYLYIVLDNQVNYLYNNDGFKKINNSDLEKMNLKFNCYEDNINIGEYYLKRGTIWNLFDENNNYKYYSNYILAINGTYPFELDSINYRELSSEEKRYINDKYNISQDIISGKTIDVDLNGDNVQEKIIISSYNGEDINTNDYNLVLIMNNKKYSEIVYNTNLNANNSYDIKAIFKLGEDKYKTIILEEIENIDGDIDTYKKENIIYQYGKKGYQKI